MIEMGIVIATFDVGEVGQNKLPLSAGVGHADLADGGEKGVVILRLANTGIAITPEIARLVGETIITASKMILRKT